MVASGELIHGVRENVRKDHQSILHTTARARQIDNDRRPDHTRVAARKHRGRDALRDTVGADRLSNARQLSFQHRKRSFWCAISGIDARAARGEYDNGSISEGRGNGLTNRRTIANNLWRANGETPITKGCRDQWTSLVFIHAG